MMTEKDTILRNATRSDAADLAMLDDYASHGLAMWLWQGAANNGRAETANLCGRRRMLDENEPTSYRNGVIAEVAGLVVGMAIGFFVPGDEGDDAFETDIRELKPLMALFAMARGGWLIDSLAVYPEYAGRGIGTQLINDQVERAARVSKSAYLVAESVNTSATRLYEKLGFTMRDRRPAVLFGSRKEPFDYILMHKPLEREIS